MDQVHNPVFWVYKDQGGFLPCGNLKISQAVV